ncbi:hypothetical protein BOX37_07695 [Nocardia mangyaensis]|uniref:IrrE N-terminal-like domain-containing protein n=1 Tax=Nocardia mangyaensis TaxID=2213200 RepID=A0A1J0VPD3_9NOCA|nr:ImmA/IrrE family metallo-endopeptidase [Nocardia mangyaensis]APE33873.1 hypothetical protein BOX37_07695 [Nocardia mangyaensis]
MHNEPPIRPHSHTLAHLRALLPPQRVHALSFRAALRIAQRQAESLHDRHGSFGAPVPDSIISSLPQLHVELVDSPISSLRFWDAGQQQWIVQLAASDAEPTRRFHLAYEFKHILDHNHRHQLYRGDEHHTTNCQAERAARNFAGLLLVPSTVLTDAWVAGTRDPTALATLFAVDPAVITARLAQIGIGKSVRTPQAGTGIDPIPNATRKECPICPARTTAARRNSPSRARPSRARMAMAEA